MRNARKTTRILELERNTPSPFAEIFDPKNIVSLSRSQQKMREAMTVDECLPELSIIARENDLNLNIGIEWREAVNIMDMRNLNLNR